MSTKFFVLLIGAVLIPITGKALTYKCYAPSKKDPVGEVGGYLTDQQVTEKCEKFSPCKGGKCRSQPNFSPATSNGKYIPRGFKR